MKSRTLLQSIDCGAFGEQDFLCYYDKSGSLEAAYAWLDREEKVNCKPELDNWTVKDLETKAYEIFSQGPDEMTLAKAKMEEEMAG